MSGLRTRQRDWARAAAQTGARGKTHLDSGSPRYLEVLWADLHDLAGLVAAWHTVQPGDPPEKLGMLYVRRGVGRGRSHTRRSGPQSRQLHAAEMVHAADRILVLLAARPARARSVATTTHHRCLGLPGGSPYSGPGEQTGMKDGQGHAYRQQPALLEYLEQHGWKRARVRGGDEVAGLCPLHRETRPSFYVNRRKNVFYCHGCGRGGDLIRLMELLEGLSFAQALLRLRGRDRAAPPLEEAVRFYERQLPGCPQAQRYLAQRGIHAAAVERMRIGYAPGGCLRAHLESCGYARQEVRDSGLLDVRGRDRFYRCLTFPLDTNLYGRSIDGGAPRHCFLPFGKGGLYGWEQARNGAAVIVVEGLFDVAALWQAGFSNAVAALGAHLNRTQIAQLCDGEPRWVYLCLDADGAGQSAACILGAKLRQAGVQVRRVELPDGHDPNSFFCAGAAASDFQRTLDRARP
jgi:DNA primase catalytic core